MAAVGPIDRAYKALAEALQQALRTAGVLASDQLLEVDPESPFAPTGDEEDLVTAAALFEVGTAQEGAELGGPGGPIWKVGRACRLEVAVAGPIDFRAERKETLELGIAACASLAAGPRATLGGTCQRVDLEGGREADALPPNGQYLALTFRLRVRSGDPLGLTEPTS